jgi:hypothetical protein
MIIVPPCPTPQISSADRTCLDNYWSLVRPPAAGDHEPAGARLLIDVVALVANCGDRVIVAEDNRKRRSHGARGQVAVVIRDGVFIDNGLGEKATSLQVR